MSLLFFIFGGFFNSVEDTLADHWAQSVFNHWGWSPGFWHKGESWTRKNTLPAWVPDALSDGWHIAKTLKLICYGLAVVFYVPLIQMFSIPVWITDFMIFGIARNIVFNLFYSKIWV